MTAPSAGPTGLLRAFAADPRPDAEIVALLRDSADRALRERLLTSLIVRHGDVVWSVCRNALGTGPDAEDAFQATFIVLCRRPPAFTGAKGLGPWLFGVAKRVSQKARVNAAKRAAVALVETPARPDGSGREELAAALREEIEALPEQLRSVVLLGLVEESKHEAAARTLEMSVMTYRRRLEEARKRLRLRLSRRGYDPASATVPPAAVAPAALMQSTAGVVLDALGGATSRAAALAAAVLSPVGAWKWAALALAVTMSVGAVAVFSAAPPAPKPPTPRDAKADEVPLPEGAVARLGTTRMRHDGEYSGVHLAADGRRCVSFGPHRAFVWDVATGRRVATIKSYELRKEIRPEPGDGWKFAAARLGADGADVLIADSDGRVFRVEVATGRVLAVGPTLPLPKGGWRDDLGPAGGVFVVHDGRTMRVVDATRPERYRDLTDSAGPLRWPALSSNGRYLATIVAGNCVIFDTRDGKAARRFPLEVHPKGHVSMAVSDDGTVVASKEMSGNDHFHILSNPDPGERNFDPNIRWWDARTGRRVGRLDGDSFHIGFHLVGNDRLWAVGPVPVESGWDWVAGRADAWQEWDLRAKRRLSLVRTSAVSKFVPACRAVVEADRNVIRVRRAGAVTEFPGGHPSLVAAIVPLPGNHTALTVDADGGRRTWNLPGGDLADYRDSAKGLVGKPIRSYPKWEISDDGGHHCRMTLLSDAPDRKESLRFSDIRSGKFVDLANDPKVWGGDGFALSADLSLLAVRVGKQVGIVTTADGKLRRSLDLEGVAYLAFLKGTRKLLALTKDEFHLIDADAGKVIRTRKWTTKFDARRSFSPATGELVFVVAGHDIDDANGPKPDSPQLIVADVTGRRADRRVPLPKDCFGEPDELVHSPDGSKVVVSNTMLLTVVDLSANKILHHRKKPTFFRFFDKPPHGLAVSDDGRYLFTAEADTTAIVWDAAALPAPDKR